MSPPFIGLAEKQEYWIALLTDLYISILILEEYLQVMKWKPDVMLLIFSSQFYEKWVSEKGI